MATLLTSYTRGTAACLSTVMCTVRRGRRQPARRLQLYPPAGFTSRDHLMIPHLTPKQVTHILSQNELKVEIMDPGPVKYFESNHLASNSPTEDQLVEAKCNYTTGQLFAVIDGHAGPECGRAVKQRLLDYIAVSMMSPHTLETVYNLLKDSQHVDIVKHYHKHQGESRRYMLDINSRDIAKFVQELISTTISWDEFSMTEALQEAFVRLDQDISSSATPSPGSNLVNYESLEQALSGCCACVVHTDGDHLHVANTGDCRAVLGQLDNENNWVAVRLSNQHNAENLTECQRIKSEHPADEQMSVIKNNRLLGQLAPLRAFGDIMYKWPVKDLKNVINILSNIGASVLIQQSLIPPKYYTPPYLTARPDIVHHKLTAKDKFLILATDGLWDMMSSQNAVKLVGEHMEGKQTLSSFSLPVEPLNLGAANQILSNRKIGLAHKPKDSNVTTHLIRNALGDSSSGIKHSKLSTMLQLSPSISRNYRDDISVTVLYFDTPLNI